MAEKLMTTEDLAEYLGVPVATVYQWRYRGKGPRGCRVGKYVRFRPADVERWLDERTSDGSRVA